MKSTFAHQIFRINVYEVLFLVQGVYVSAKFAGRMILCEPPVLSSANMRCTCSLGVEGVCDMGAGVGVKDGIASCSLERSMRSFAYGGLCQTINGHY